jgi:hypothetical protein
MNFFCVTNKDFLKIKEDLLAGRKINAIKCLRRGVIGVEGAINLRDAKESVEKLQHEMGLGRFPNAVVSATKIVAGPVVKRIVVDMGDGEIEVDIENMQLVALTQLQKIGLDACGHLLELVQAIKSFSEGERIGVIKNEEKENDEMGS